MAVVEDVQDEQEIPRQPSASSSNAPFDMSDSTLRQRRPNHGSGDDVDTPGSGALPPVVEDGPEFFDIAIITMPFVFLYLLLDILVHLQYQHRPSLDHITMSVIKAVPTLSVIVYYTTKHSTHFLTTSLLMSASIISGCRLIWLVNMAGWSMTTDQAPAMGTLWILTIVQLPLSRALLALLGVAGWTWYTGMKVTP